MSRALRQSICRDVIVLMEGLFVCLLLLLFLGGGAMKKTLGQDIQKLTNYWRDDHNF